MYLVIKEGIKETRRLLKWTVACGFSIKMCWWSKTPERRRKKQVVTQCDCVVESNPGIVWDLFAWLEVNHSHEWLITPRRTKSRGVNYKTAPISYLFLSERSDCVTSANILSVNSCGFLMFLFFFSMPSLAPTMWSCKLQVRHVRKAQNQQRT